MGVPFSGFVVPGLAYLLVLGAGTVLVTGLLASIRPPISQRTVLAFVPWIGSGAALHVLYQFGQTRSGVFPEILEPLFGAPAVYLTAFILAGGVWALATLVVTRSQPTAAAVLGAVGGGLFIGLVTVLTWRSLQPAVGTVRISLPAAGIVLAIALTLAVHRVLQTYWPDVLDGAKLSGTLVLFAHVLDGVTTAIGVDLLGTGERSYLPRLIMDVAGELPTEPFLGVGWLFILVKLGIALAIVASFAPYVRDVPARGHLLYAGIMAVGLGPATNNLLVFIFGI